MQAAPKSLFVAVLRGLSQPGPCADPVSSLLHSLGSGESFRIHFPSRTSQEKPRARTERLSFPPMPLAAGTGLGFCPARPPPGPSTTEHSSLPAAIFLPPIPEKPLPQAQVHSASVSTLCSTAIWGHGEGVAPLSSCRWVMLLVPAVSGPGVSHPVPKSGLCSCLHHGHKVPGPAGHHGPACTTPSPHSPRCVEGATRLRHTGMGEPWLDTPQ